MRSTRDAITGIKTYLSEWGIADDAKLKAIDKAAKAEVDEAVAQAKKDAFPDLKAFWTDIYVGDASRDARNCSLMLCHLRSTMARSHRSPEAE